MQLFLKWMCDWKSYMRRVFASTFSLYSPIKKKRAGDASCDQSARSAKTDEEFDFVDSHDLLVEEPVVMISYPIRMEAEEE
jgi:hypothetical protein